MRFPPDFLFGVATAAFQIEGATQADGRGESIWDRFARTPGNVHNGDTGDPACDHYHRWEQDLDLMQMLGVGAYRFSIAWPRILPGGTGAPNRKGIDFYRRLLEGLHARGIRPYATLYHWDLPQALQERGGWANRDSAAWFADYARLCFNELGDLVDDWITINEPWVVAILGYAHGTKAPGHTDWREALAAAHHLLLGHGLAVRALRDTSSAARVGITLDLTPAEPATPNPEDVAAAVREDGSKNRWFLDAVLRGRYPEDMVAWYERRLGPLDFERPGDLAVASAPCDFLGVNFYTRIRARASTGDGMLASAALPADGPVTGMRWAVAPDALRDVLLRIEREYGHRAILITENGAAYDDRPDGRGGVADPERLEYFRAHLEAVERAIRDGVDIRGYFAWSLLDNFEWENGYDKRFGIVFVDYETQERLPKQSALWYRDLIAKHAGG
jgi:beta-glucosidase